MGTFSHLTANQLGELGITIVDNLVRALTDTGATLSVLNPGVSKPFKWLGSVTNL